MIPSSKNIRLFTNKYCSSANNVLRIVIYLLIYSGIPYSLSTNHDYGGYPDSCDLNEQPECTQTKSVDDKSKTVSNIMKKTDGHIAWIEPGEIGDENTFNFGDRILRRVTRAKDPPVYVIHDFLKEDEADKLRKHALKLKLEPSTSHAEGITFPYKGFGRKSKTTWIHYTDYDKIVKKLSRRFKRLTELPMKYIQKAELLQVAQYEKHGHYYTHTDSHNTVANRPCCGRVECEENSKFCCQLCRYITVMVYLNDVIEGGETVFPVADASDETLKKYQKEKPFDLSKHCYNSSLIITPSKGMAVMWYNHKLNPTFSGLGDLIERSYHGGCDVKYGEKWIANLWVVVDP
ncbi:hypothetical protein SNE40_007448 [Patella caerulea]|uniref:Fe2OG dioxygenase domain-containing protein n=1 Tax=Patella caerulea TaxID=87958 RepID=A0AAN8K4L8_PATCE